jgi:CheY-like chemotaxis protein
MGELRILKVFYASIWRRNSMKLNSNLVLCVDDEVVGLQVRKILLERAGYRVLTASDGPSGLDIFTSEPVEAVVLDYSMPGMHGGEVAVRMRQAKPQVPILLLSAYMGLSAEVTSLVDLYMTKGEGAPVLLEKLSSLLQPVNASQE